MDNTTIFFLSFWGAKIRSKKCSLQATRKRIEKEHLKKNKETKRMKCGGKETRKAPGK